MKKNKIKLNKQKGIFFWITGLSGSGKTIIAKKILKSMIDLYGPTLLMSGDSLRRIFKFKTKTNLDKLISIMMRNDLEIELNGK